LGTTSRIGTLFTQKILSLFLLLLQTTVYSSEVKSDHDKIEFMLTNKVVGPELKILSLKHEARI